MCSGFSTIEQIRTKDFGHLPTYVDSDIVLRARVFIEIYPFFLTEGAADHEKVEGTIFREFFDLGRAALQLFPDDLKITEDHHQLSKTNK
ncbi:MAG: hypothetical protein R3D25_22655 [Geminicoccaceae bacterium]